MVKMVGMVKWREWHGGNGGMVGMAEWQNGGNGGNGGRNGQNGGNGQMAGMAWWEWWNGGNGRMAEWQRMAGMADGMVKMVGDGMVEWQKWLHTYHLCGRKVKMVGMLKKDGSTSFLELHVEGFFGSPASFSTLSKI